MTTKIIENKIPNKTLSQGMIVFHLIIVTLLFILAYLFLKDDFLTIKLYIKDIKKGKLLFIGLFFIVTIISIVAHELIHGYFFAKYNHSGWKTVKFGFNKELLSPYATCQEPVKVKHFRIIAIMPTIILGIIPLLISLLLNHNLLLFFYASFMIISGIGDMLVLWFIRKLDANHFIIDHPDALGYFTIHNYHADNLPKIQKFFKSLNIKQQTIEKSGTKKLLIIFFISVLTVFVIKEIMRRF